MKNEESILQRNIVSVFRLKYSRLSRRLFSIPNGGKRNVITASILKSEGATAGVCDLFLAVPNKKYAGMFIEVKTAAGRLSPNQIEFIGEVRGDYEVVVVRSVEAFLNEVEKYLAA